MGETWVIEVSECGQDRLIKLLAETIAGLRGPDLQDRGRLIALLRTVCDAKVKP